MKELVEVIAKSLVDYPDEVVVTETENEKRPSCWNCALHSLTWVR